MLFWSCVVLPDVPLCGIIWRYQPGRLSSDPGIHLRIVHGDHHHAPSHRNVTCCSVESALSSHGSSLRICPNCSPLRPCVSLKTSSSDVPWYADSEWNNVKGQLSTIDRHYGHVHSVIHSIGTHQIHHLFTKVPHYHLGNDRFLV